MNHLKSKLVNSCHICVIQLLEIVTSFTHLGNFMPSLLVHLQFLKVAGYPALSELYFF